MPSVEKLPSGNWRGLYRDANGEKQRVPGTFPRKTDAREAAVDAEAKAKRKAAAKKGTLTARTPWGEWWRIFNDDDRTFDSDNGYVEDSMVKNHVMPKWGEIPLNAIAKHGENGVQPWVDSLVRRGYKPNYVRSIIRPLRASINAAVDQEILTASPCAGIKLPRPPKGAKPFVSTRDQAKLAPELNARFVDAMDFMLETGVRPGELAGLHADKLDLDDGWMTVADVYVQRRKMIRTHPKDGDRRDVPLSAKAVEILRRQLGDRDLTGGCGIEHMDGKPCKSVLVWLNVRGGVLHPNLLGRRMRAASAEAEIESRTGYAARRGFATRAIEGGADVFTVKAIMGHADLDQLAEYVQRTPESRAKLLAALGERTELSVVDGMGRRGTSRGTDSDNQALPDATDGDVTDAL